MIHCGEFSEVYIKTYSFIVGFEEKNSLSFNFKSEGWEKIENIRLESCSQMLEKTIRVQDPV